MCECVCAWLWRTGEQTERSQSIDAMVGILARLGWTVDGGLVGRYGELAVPYRPILYLGLIRGAGAKEGPSVG